MDGGSGLNLLYAETYDAMGLSSAPFHEVIPRIQVVPLGQVDLLIMFRSHVNFCTEVLTNKIANFLGAYCSILGWQCYA